MQLETISKSYAGQILFEGLSWSLPPGSRFGLVGPNGAGKTTLLRILTGAETPDGGSVHRPGRLGVGLLPQEVEAVEGGSVLGAVLAGFGELSGLEQRLAELEHRLASAVPGTNEAAEQTRLYGEVRERYEALGGDRLEFRAKVILSGLGIEPRRFHDPLHTLSGGWRMRVVLARLLLAEPGLLLLDEPTNHLDLPAIQWLEGFLAAYAGAFVVVSHDRFFLNRTVRSIHELDRGRLTAYAGGYDDYVAAKAVREAALAQAAKQQAREVAKVERFIERFRYKNTKARQVQSRIKALEKVAPVVVPRARRSVRFGFPPPVRSGDIVVRVEGLHKAYGPTQVYRELDFLLRRGDRVALVGPNGAGKSTLLKLIGGRELPDAGRIELGHQVDCHYYAQHQLEALDPGATVLEEAERVVEPGERPRIRKLLGCFLFTGDDVDKRVGVLSGGEKARLALAKMMIRPANLLLLDEPTNHLDLGSREVLEDALNEFDATLVVVSHDRYFINRIATRIAEVRDGGVISYDGDYDSFLALPRQDAGTATGDEAAADSAGPGRPEERREARRREADERNRLYRRRKAMQERLEPLESRIGAVERRLGELELQQTEPGTYSSPDRAAGVAREKQRLEEELARLYEDWTRAADGLEST